VRFVAGRNARVSPPCIAVHLSTKTLESADAKAACGFEPHSRHWELFENRTTRAIVSGVGRRDAGTIWVLDRFHLEVIAASSMTIGSAVRSPSHVDHFNQEPV
jgi:hypothetical protein